MLEVQWHTTVLSSALCLLGSTRMERGIYAVPDVRFIRHCMYCRFAGASTDGPLGRGTVGGTR